MTIIVRKDNIIATDSLIFEGRPEGPSVIYRNKIKKNKAGTMLIIYSGNNYEGTLLELLDLTSNIIYNMLLEDKIPSYKNIPEEFIEILTGMSEADKDFSCMLVTKLKTFHIKLYAENQVMLYTYDKEELVYAGGGSNIIGNLSNINNLSVPCIVQKVINYTGSCNGNINVFDLNLLRDIEI